MTKPSKAQIDRAAVHLTHLFTERGGPTYEEMAECALIAAAGVGEPLPSTNQIEAVKDTLRRLVILTGDSPWDWDDVARKVLDAAAKATAKSD